MKIRHKFMAVVAFFILSVIAIASLAFYHHSFILFTLMLFGLCVVASVFTYYMFLKRIEDLNNDLIDVHAGNSKTQQVKVEGFDELSEIAARVNVLFETVKLSRKQLFLLSEKEEDQVSTQTSSKSTALLDKSGEKKSQIPGRVQFNEALNKAISYAKRHNKILAVMAIDLEYINSSPAIKTEIAPEIMNEFAKQFSGVLRNEDLLAKLDGNEFIVLLHDIGKPKFASAIAEKLLHVVSTGLSINYSSLMLRASIGVCICPNDTNTLEEAIEKTYAALYRAKAMPGNNYQFHTQQLDLEAREYVHMKADLQKALENNELVLHYQPKLGIKKGSIIGVEVLIRWNHPTLGMLTPAKFLEVAEDSGFIIPIGAWAMREACKVNAHWQKEGYEHLTVSVNLSTKEFHDPGLLKTIASVLNDTKLNPNYLELEINEETMMKDLDKTAKIMKDIVALGVQISIDHFGKGHTSIAHLKNLPITTIKIDRGFIKGIPLNPNDSAITSAIIALAHYLGISVLAEGVENAEQLQYLSQQNCDMVQGYFLSYPLPVEAIVQQLKKISDRALS